MMGPLGGILVRVILPLMLMAGTGYLLQKTVRLDIRTLSKLNVNLLVPCFLFDKFYHLNLPLREAQAVVLYTFGIMASLALLGLGTARLMRLPRGLTVAFIISIVFYNSGNYGLSVMELVFGRESPAMEIQALVLTTQNITNFTLGVLFISAGSHTWRQSLWNVVRYPIVPSFVLAVLLRQSGVALPSFLLVPVERISLALVPMGLVTLGAQIGAVSGVHSGRLLGISAFYRLLVGPLLGVGLILLFGLSGLTAQVLLISCAVPTAVNTALLSIEFRNEAEFASQAVLFSTLLSVLTVTVVIYLAQLWQGG